MKLNSELTTTWKADIQKSVATANAWFIETAPKTFTETRDVEATVVARDLLLLGSISKLDPAKLRANPGMLRTLRMVTAPPIARDRLIGLADTTKPVVERLEQGKLPKNLTGSALDSHLDRICKVIRQLADPLLASWILGDDGQRTLAASVVADRLTGAVANPLIRNAQEARQLQVLQTYLEGRGLQLHSGKSPKDLSGLKPGTFTFRMNVMVGPKQTVKMPIDAVIMPRRATTGSLPILIEAKSAGDYTNVNKRRKEEAQKAHQLTNTYPEITFLLLLGGYFDAGYLGYSAHEGLDWVWEHRIEDLDMLNL